jgi:excisionase family DNA binding protein
MSTSILQHHRPLASAHPPVPHSEQPHTISIKAELINVFTLADHFNVHYRTVQRWTKNKWIPHYRVRKSVRYNLSEVMRATASHGT